MYSVFCHNIVVFFTYLRIILAIRAGNQTLDFSSAIWNASANNNISRPALLTIGLPKLYHNTTVAYMQEFTDNFNVSNNYRDLDTTLQNTVRLIVRAHNELRRSVRPAAANMLRMQWSLDAALSARQWAATCEPHTITTITKASGMVCGFNIASVNDSRAMPWPFVIKEWYDELDNFTYGDWNNESLHYSQLVWADSYQVGCGYQNCNSTHIYVCQYCPAGNMLGHEAFPYKAGETCELCPGQCKGQLCSNPCHLYDAYSNCDELNLALNICREERYVRFRSGCSATCNCPRLRDLILE